MKPNSKFLALILVVITALPLSSYAVDRTTPFSPGETIDPGAESVEPCGPTDANCFPSISTLSGLTINGNLGVTSTTTTQNLHVSGEGNVVGNFTAGNLLPGTPGSATPSVVKTTITSDDLGYGMGMAKGPDGLARIAYIDYNTYALKYVRCNDSDCSSPMITEVVPETYGSYPGSYIMALGSDGFARILYNDSSDGHLNMVRCLDEDCTTKNIDIIDSDNTNIPGYYGAQIVMGDDGFPRIVTADDNSEMVRFTLCSDEDCISPVSNDIETSYNYQGAAIAIGQDHLPRIVYMNYDDYFLKLARCTDAACSSPVITTINSSPYSGYYGVVVRIGSDGFARIAYADYGNGDLVHYLVCGDEDCSSPTITDLESSDENTSNGIGFDLRNGDLPSISYEAAYGETHLINCTTATCSAFNDVPVDTINMEAGGPVVIGNDNLPMMAYSDENTAIKFARLRNLSGTNIISGSALGTINNSFGEIYAKKLFIDGEEFANQWTASSTDLYRLIGNINIGKTFYGPNTAKLHLGDDNFTRNGPILSVSGYASNYSATTSIADIVGGWEHNSPTKNALLRVSAYDTINTTPALQILYNGNVGIGTSTPLSNLHVYNGSLLVGTDELNTSTAYGFKVNGNSNVFTEAYLNTQGTNLGFYTNPQAVSETGLLGIAYPMQSAGIITGVSTPLVLGTGLTERMRILGNGNVGIGTTTPAFKLSVAGDINLTGNLYQNGTLFSTSQWATLGSDLSYTSGNVAIGTTTSTEKLTVAGNIKISGSGNGLYFPDGTFLGSSAGAGSGLTSDGDLSFAADNDLDGNGKISLATNGTTHLTVLNNGNVGIGTTTPTEKLNVLGNILVTGGGNYMGVGDGIHGAILDRRFNLDDGTYVVAAAPAIGANSNAWGFNSSTGYNFAINSANALSIPSNGNVGIGTSTPNQKLSVYGNINLTNSSGADFGIRPGTDGDITGYITFRHGRVQAFNDDGGDASFSGGSLYIPAYGSTYSNELSSNGPGNNYIAGNLGIGTTTIPYKLTVDGTVGFNGNTSLLAVNANNGGSQRLYFNGLGSTGNAQSGSIFLQSYGGLGGEALTLSVSQGGGFSIYSHELLLGAPVIRRNGPLNIQSTGVSSSDGLTLGNGYDQLAGNFVTFKNGNASAAMVIDYQGSVGIATTTPWKTLSVNGGVALSGLTAAGGSDQFLCLSSNNEVTTGANCAGSSERFKHDIQTISDNLATVLKLRPVTFEYNDVPGERVGLIAEEVNQIDPRLVFYDEDGVTPRGVRYQDFAPILAGAIQDQQKEIAGLVSWLNATSTGDITKGEDNSLVGSLLDNLVTWLGDAENKITDLFAGRVHTQTLCVGTKENETCINKDELDNLLNQHTTVTTTTTNTETQSTEVAPQEPETSEQNIIPETNPVSEDLPPSTDGTASDTPTTN